MDLNVTAYAIDAGVATVTLDRPERLNAWTNRMEGELRFVLREADRDPEVRAIVITGAGRGFCAGADMDALHQYAEGRTYDLTPATPTPHVPDEVPPDWRGAFTYLLGLAKPVIAAVNGPAAGVGFVLMCFADIRFAAAGAKLTTSFARLGLPAEHGVSWMLPRLVGAGRAADLLMSSRVVLAEEAAEIGLVNKVFPAEDLMAETYAYAKSIAAEMAPSSLAVIKRQLWADLATSLAPSWQFATARMTAMLRSAEFAEGVAAFTEKRPPAFPGFSHQ